MKFTWSINEVTACYLALALCGCAALVPLESATKDIEAKTFQTVPKKSNIYVIRTCAYGGRLHDVSLDGGTRISLACKTYAVFSVNPGEHKLSVFSTENREMLNVVTRENENYFIEMGWRIGSGTGDVKATVVQLNTQEGMKAVKESHLISLDGY
jgi:hypothetical protein